MRKDKAENIKRERDGEERIEIEYLLNGTKGKVEAVAEVLITQQTSRVEGTNETQERITA